MTSSNADSCATVAFAGPRTGNPVFSACTGTSLREIMNKPIEGTAIRLTQLAHGGG
jgi:hypothetical protein